MTTQQKNEREARLISVEVKMAADLKQQFQALQEQKKQKLMRRNELNRASVVKDSISKESLKSTQNGLMLSMFDEVDDDLNLMQVIKIFPLALVLGQMRHYPPQKLPP